MIDVFALPFDQYQRYRLVADLVGRVRADRPHLTVLDVGGRTALLRSFLPNDKVHLVDVEVSDERGLVLGDGAKLPYKDGAFDVVCAFDTLEHVPPPLRDAFVRECARVSRGHVLLAGPYKAEPVDEAEELLKSFMNDKLGVQHRYLEEHRTNGLPERDRTEELLSESGCQVTRHGHGNLDRWVVLMCMELYMDHDPLLRPLAERFFRFYNENLYASDHAGPVYRHVVIGAKPGLALPSAEGLLDDPVAPVGTFKACADLGLELLAFDSEQDAWRPELERLKGIIGDLEDDLQGHQSRLSDTKEDLDAHKQNLSDLQQTYDDAVAAADETQATLEADLEAHKLSLSDARRDLADQITRVDECQAAREQERTELEGELKSSQDVYAETVTHLTALEQNHEQTVAAFEQERRAINGELAARDEHVTELQRVLGESQASASALNAQLVEANAQSAQLGATLGDREQRLEQARALLRDRKASFKRAFGPKKPTP
ncbi:MAG: putative nucleic acid-binding Zn-ribbon protein [Planctomycetota bacterium]|jgi:predicted  nucleic acid-binding Zn-ribbon protein